MQLQFFVRNGAMSLPVLLAPLCVVFFCCFWGGGGGVFRGDKCSFLPAHLKMPALVSLTSMPDMCEDIMCAAKGEAMGLDALIDMQTFEM